jgi:hypothetical protein
MLRRLAIVLLLAAPVLVGPAHGARADATRLIATVGPGFTIDFTDADGKRVDTLVEGTYEILVRDRSEIHNWAMGNKAGSSLLVDSGVEFVGEKTFTLTLVPGRYGYACSPHWQVMNGSFTVVSAASPPPPAPPPPPPPIPTRPVLRAVAPAAGAAALTPRTVRSGLCRISVTDRSTTRGFRLVGPGVDKRTGKAFVGTVRWDVRLARGTYRFGGDPVLSGRLVVR